MEPRNGNDAPIKKRPSVNHPKSKKRRSTQPAKKGKKARRKNKALSIISSLLYYLMLLVLIFAAYQYGADKSKPKLIYGYSLLTVLTSSMQDVLPQGSMLLVKQVDINTIKIGDDITFMKNETTYVTHRVVDIIENFDDTGERGFQTKGVNNPMPDDDIVYAGHVLGVVVFHVPHLGKIAEVFTENILIFAVMIGLSIVLVIALRYTLAPAPKKKKKRKRKPQGNTQSKRKKQGVHHQEP
jgi:signal peptidase